MGDQRARGAILAAMPADEFVADLKSCIRSAATRSSPKASDAWADHCESVTAKVDFQRASSSSRCWPLYRKHGYAAALWCAIYTGGWPLGWTDGDWYSMYLCPEYRVCEGRRLVREHGQLDALVALLLVRGGRPPLQCEQRVTRRRGDGHAFNFSRVPRRRRRAAAAAPPPPRHRPSLAAPSALRSRPPRTQHGWHKPIFAMSCALVPTCTPRFGQRRGAVRCCGRSAVATTLASTRIKAIAEAHYVASAAVQGGLLGHVGRLGHAPVRTRRRQHAWPSQMPPRRGRLHTVRTTTRRKNRPRRSPSCSSDVEAALSNAAPRTPAWKSRKRTSAEPHPLEEGARRAVSAWRMGMRVPSAERRPAPGGERVGPRRLREAPRAADHTTTAARDALPACRRASAPCGDSPTEFGAPWRTTCETAPPPSPRRGPLHLRHHLRHLRRGTTRRSTLSADEFRDIIRRSNPRSRVERAPAGGTAPASHAPSTPRCARLRRARGVHTGRRRRLRAGRSGRARFAHGRAIVAALAVASPTAAFIA